MMNIQLYSKTRMMALPDGNELDGSCNRFDTIAPLGGPTDGQKLNISRSAW